MSELYGAGLTHIHDIGYRDFVKQAIPGMLDRLDEYVDKGAHVIDLGCGAGHSTKALLKAGYEVTAVDQSKAMIRLARQNAPGARFITKPALEAKLPPASAVVCIGEVINFLGAAKNAKQLFRTVGENMEKGGVILGDVLIPSTRGSESSDFRKGKEWAILVDRNELNGKLTRKITTFVQKGRNYARTDEVHKLNLHQPNELRQWLRVAGFKAKIRSGYAPGNSLGGRRRVFIGVKE